MLGPLHLTQGARTIGLRERDNGYTSLHGHRFKQPEKSRKSSDPILASPRGSSSDEKFDGNEVPDDGASDDSEFGTSETKGKLNRDGLLRTRTDSSQAKSEDGTKRELSVDSSTIKATSFTTGTGPGSSQSSQKRRNVDVDDDDLSNAFSQPKKLWTSYGRARGSVTKTASPKKSHPKRSEKAKPAFRTKDIGSMLAGGKRPLRACHLGMDTADLEQLTEQNQTSLVLKRFHLGRHRSGIRGLHNARSRAHKSRLKVHPGLLSSPRGHLPRKNQDPEQVQQSAKKGTLYKLQGLRR